MSQFLPQSIRPCKALFGAVALLAASGCWSPPPPSEHELRSGLVYMFPGIEGGSAWLREPCAGFRDAGVTSAIRIHNWETVAGITNLIHHEKNRRDADRVAESIAEYAAQYPGRPIDLVGYSGGGGMAVMVAEALPPEVVVRHVVLAQPALSPQYDLSTALSRINGRIVNFHSPLDVGLLGVGTSLFGNMDRRFGPAAGMGGFDLNVAAPSPRLRAKVEQRAWDPAMMADGHMGNHFSILNRRWNQMHVAPFLMGTPVTGALR